MTFRVQLTFDCYNVDVYGPEVFQLTTMTKFVNGFFAQKHICNKMRREQLKRDMTNLQDTHLMKFARNDKELTKFAYIL